MSYQQAMIKCDSGNDGMVLLGRAMDLAAQADQEIADLQESLVDEIRRSTRLMDQYNREVLGLNNEGDAIGGEPPRGLKHYAEAYFEQCRALERIIRDFQDTGEYVGLWQHVYELRYPDGSDEHQAQAGGD